MNAKQKFELVMVALWSLVALIVISIAIATA